MAWVLGRGLVAVVEGLVGQEEDLEGAVALE
jgi:hypothetical protein